MVRDYHLTAGNVKINNYGSNFEVFFISDNNECDFSMDVSHDELIDFNCKENVEEVANSFCENYFKAKSKELPDEGLNALKEILKDYVYPHSTDVL